MGFWHNGQLAKLKEMRAPKIEVRNSEPKDRQSKKGLIDKEKYLSICVIVSFLHSNGEKRGRTKKHD